MPVEHTLSGEPDNMDYDHTRQDEDQYDNEEQCVQCGKIVDLDVHGWSVAADGERVVCPTCAINNKINAMEAAGVFPNPQVRRNIIQMMLGATAIANAIEQGGSSRAEGFTGDMFREATVVSQTQLLRDEDEEAHDPGASSSGIHREAN